MDKILNEIRNSSGKETSYIIGGWLRDKILKRENKDLDIIVRINPFLVASKLSRKLAGRLVVLDDKNKVYRIALKNNSCLEFIDVAGFKGKDILSDLKKRDFTINSFALPIEENLDFKTLIDPFNGIGDFKKGLIRMTSTNSFKDDPLRLLRAFRFAAELQFKIEPKTGTLIKKQSCLINRSAGERIREELLKILNNDNSFYWITELDKAGLLEVIMPEIIKMKKSARQFYYHPLGLWQHSLETLMSLEEIIVGVPRLFGENASFILKHLEEPLSSGTTRRSLLKMVSLLHDIAKPFCARRIGKRMRFLGHEVKGSKMVKNILERLHFGRQEIKIADVLVQHHMRPISLGQSPVLTDRAIYRLFRDIGDNLVDLMLLTLSDCYSYRRLKVRKAVELKKQKLVVKKLISRYFHEKNKKPAAKLIDGNVILSKFRIQPGPIIGKLLKETAEAQALGKINTKEEAVSYARKLLTRLKKRNRI
ncbi:MAG: HD domain-containing protein [Elusimicrobia bacterium]|nr:HD domain-containing protein [Candidatus Liberimonas magnetica]